MAERKKVKQKTSSKLLAERIAGRERIKGKRTAKDSLFTHLFSEAEYRFLLFHALHPEMPDVRMEDVTPLTLTNVVVDRPYNDLALLVEGKLLIMVEMQSTWSINVLPRLIMYLAQTYSDYINAMKLDLYGTSALPLPEPELYVLYTGKRKDHPTEINFRKEFFAGKEVAIDATAKVIYDGEQGDIINQYVAFCHVLDEQYRDLGRTAEAVRETIRICKDRNVLNEYLQKHESEVIDIMLTVFDQETAINNHVAAVAREAAQKAAREARADQDLLRLRSLMANLKLSAQEAMSALGIPVDQQAAYAARL